MNKLEKFVSYILDKNNIQYIYQFFLSKDGVCKSYDFKIKDTNIATIPHHMYTKLKHPTNTKLGRWTTPG
jgi:hypothetical protein